MKVLEVARIHQAPAASHIPRSVFIGAPICGAAMLKGNVLQSVSPNTRTVASAQRVYLACLQGRAVATEPVHIDLFGQMDSKVSESMSGSQVPRAGTSELVQTDYFGSSEYNSSPDSFSHPLSLI